MCPIVLDAFIKKKLFFTNLHLIFCRAQVFLGLLHSASIFMCKLQEFCICELTLQRLLKRYTYANMTIRSYLCLRLIKNSIPKNFILILTPCNFWAWGMLVNEGIGLLSQLILILVFPCEKKTKINRCFLWWKHLIILYLIHDAILVMHYNKAVKNWFSVAHKLQWIYFLKKGWCTTIASVDIYSNFTVLLVNLKISWWDV